MTFKHKLAKRLAMIRDTAGLLPAAAILACTAGDQAVSGPTQPSFLSSASNPSTILFQETFADTAFAARGWYDNPSMVTTTAQHIPGSTAALEAHFPIGATTPTWGGAARHLFPATPTLYVSYWVKYSDNWVGSGHPYHPHEFQVMSDLDGDWDGPANGWLVAYIEHNYQSGGIPRLALQDNKAINTSYGAPPINLVNLTENRSTDGCNGVVEPNVVATCFNMLPWYNDKELSAPQVWFQPTPGPGYKGNWNHVEVYFQINSIVNGVGQADGVMQYWFNGASVIDRHDILFRTGARPSINFHQFLIAPYIGDVAPGSATISATSGGITGSAALTVAAPITNPGAVSDLAVAGVADSSATLSFTEVNDGTGRPASYDIRMGAGTIAWGSAAIVTRGSCTTPVVGSAIGAKRSCTVLGLVPSTGYQFQLVAFRGTMNLNAAYGALSNVASGTTALARAAVASVAVSPATAGVQVGATARLTATPKDATGTPLDGRVVTWATSNTSVATVSGSGLVSGVGAGRSEERRVGKGRRSRGAPYH